MGIWDKNSVLEISDPLNKFCENATPEVQLTWGKTRRSSYCACRSVQRSALLDHSRKKVKYTEKWHKRIFRLWSRSSQPIPTIFGIFGEVTNIIEWVNLHIDRSRVVFVRRVPENRTFPHESAVVYARMLDITFWWVTCSQLSGCLNRVRVSRLHDTDECHDWTALVQVHPRLETA